MRDTSGKIKVHGQNDFNPKCFIVDLLFKIEDEEYLWQFLALAKPPRRNSGAITAPLSGCTTNTTMPSQVSPHADNDTPPRKRDQLL